jgi:hypothetical protein
MIGKVPKKYFLFSIPSLTFSISSFVYIHHIHSGPRFLGFYNGLLICFPTLISVPCCALNSFVPTSYVEILTPKVGDQVMSVEPSWLGLMHLSRGPRETPCAFCHAWLSEKFPFVNHIWWGRPSPDTKFWHLELGFLRLHTVTTKLLLSICLPIYGISL